MKSCNDCVNHKYYPDVKNNTYALWCTGVTLMDGSHKKTEKLDTDSKANDCKFYDTDSWTK
jgi:hypothetical protein